jgi:transcriptional regulator with XRE-family HTH domain
VSTKKTTERLKTSKQHRAAYVASQINIGIPFQIRALRKQRDWEQKRLAAEADMAQPRISAMESPGYGNFNLETLKRLASAFDVALVVRFAPFSELMRWSDNFSPDDFQVLGFNEELEKVDTSTDNVVAFNYLTTARNQTAANKSAANHLPQIKMQDGVVTAVKQVAQG